MVAVPRSATSSRTIVAAAVIADTQDVCAGSTVDGWIVVNTRYNLGTCGQPHDPAIKNVWTIRRLASIPVGGTLTACQGDVPKGWVLINTAYSLGTCGEPHDPKLKNVMVIKRLS